MAGWPPVEGAHSLRIIAHREGKVALNGEDLKLNGHSFSPSFFFLSFYFFFFTMFTQNIYKKHSQPFRKWTEIELCTQLWNHDTYFYFIYRCLYEVIYVIWLSEAKTYMNTLVVVFWIYRSCVKHNSCVYCFGGRIQFWEERRWFLVLCSCFWIQFTSCF